MKKVALATEIAEAVLYLHTRSPPIIHGRLHPITLGQAPYLNISTIDSLHQQLEKKTSPAPLDDLNCDSRTINLLGMCWAWEPTSRLPMSDIVAILTGKPFLFTKVWSIEVK
ncbi:hypothetical protein FRB99_001571, partial [Tulasnella sp. 403]